MNAAVRSITRVALSKGCVPYCIYEGYQGLVDGGDKIRPFGWEDVRGYLSKGGTAIGTARCMAFRTREGRLEGCFNLIKNGIDALVIIGGDGSLTGADTLRAEWTGLVDELVAKGRLQQHECEHLRQDLTIVGLVGSIDNDMSATDITIGAFTALHRICESVDSLTSTAQSHQRAFVVEVMGRHCGWLALMAAIAVGADAVFLPERPPPLNQEKYGMDWESEMCDMVKQNRLIGARKSMIIVCEGAIDRNLKPIKCDYVKKILEDRLGLDTRVTNLGHVQRGGRPCAFDRYLATVQGAEAVDAVLRSNRNIPAPMIGMSHNKVVCVPLMEAVKLTHSVADAIGKKDFAKAMELRDPDFHSSYNAYIESTQLSQSFVQKLPEDKRLRIGIIHVGAPAGGMNAATRTAARLCIARGHTPVAIKNGFSGLLRGELQELKWGSMIGWQTRGGSELGCNRDHPKPLPGSRIPLGKGIEDYVDLGMIAYALQKHKIQSLILVGGFEAFSSQLVLTTSREVYPALCIPMIHIPATVSNNVPGTDYSLGSDTALNVIVEACDRIKLSANASRKRVFVVEVQGGNCGYLATLSGLTVGATSTYIPEKGITLSKLQEDVDHMKNRYRFEDEQGIPNEGRLVLRAENTKPEVYSTETVSGIFRAEGEGLFDSRTAVLGHLQQGDTPSPLDRVRATRLATEAIDWIQKTTEANGHFTTDPRHSVVIGVRGAKISVSPVLDVLQETDMKLRRAKEQWWYPLDLLQRLLAKRDIQSRL
ncbi:phosphofructokinase domain-containing protein [Gorgonomyces haynaldii]|nr:phosphofructokinase domain-containing protein [Gorgonomyces haynaldii]